MKENFETFSKEDKEYWGGEKAELNAEIARIAGDAHGGIEKELVVVRRMLGYEEGTTTTVKDYHLSYETLIEYFRKIAERAEKAAGELEDIKQG